MDVEYRQMHAALGGDHGQLGKNEVVLWQCGIGKVNAAIGSMRLIAEHKPDVIVSTGLAGGIDDSLRVGDIFAAEKCVYHDVYCGMGCEWGQVQGLPTYFEASAQLLRAAQQVPLATGERLVQGLICTGDQFITERTAQESIKKHFPKGLACDMESAAIAHTCHLQQVPFLSLRVISDTPGNTDDHAAQWESFLHSMCDRSFRFVTQFLQLIA